LAVNTVGFALVTTWCVIQCEGKLGSGEQIIVVIAVHAYLDEKAELS